MKRSRQQQPLMRDKRQETRPPVSAAPLRLILWDRRRQTFTYRESRRSLCRQSRPLFCRHLVISARRPLRQFSSPLITFPTCQRQASLHLIVSLDCSEGTELKCVLASTDLFRNSRPAVLAHRRRKSAFEPGADDDLGLEFEPLRPRHSRRSSLVPGLGRPLDALFTSKQPPQELTELGSAPVAPAPPAARPISVSIRPSNLSEDPSVPTGFFAAHAILAPSPASQALARSSSVQTNASSVFRFPALQPPTRPVAIPAATPDAEPVAFLPESPLPPPPHSPVKAIPDDFLETHPLYRLLSQSPAPRVKAAWSKASLVLVPPRERLPTDIEEWLFDDENDASPPWQAWVASHAFKSIDTSDRAHEVYASADDAVNLEAVVNATEKQVKLGAPGLRPGATKRAMSDIPFPMTPPLLSPLIRPSPLSASPARHSPLSFAPSAESRQQTLQILQEQTVYRQTPASFSLPMPAVELPVPRKERPMSRMSKWFRTASATKAKSSQPPTPDPADEALPPSPGEDVLEKVRLVAVSADFMPWHHDDAASCFEDASEEESRQETVPTAARTLLQCACALCTQATELKPFSGTLPSSSVRVARWLAMLLIWSMLFNWPSRLLVTSWRVFSMSVATSITRSR